MHTLMGAVSAAHADAMTERELELARDERKGQATREEVEAMTEFINLVVFPVAQKSGVEAALRMARRWPRAKPHWRRLRRRVCEHCWKRKDLSEPRLWVCGGCGVARYCGEKWQAKDFSHHSKCCPLLARRWDGVGSSRSTSLIYAIMKTPMSSPARGQEKEYKIGSQQIANIPRMGSRWLKFIK